MGQHAGGRRVGRIDSLDALRGVLAIGVMIYHLTGWLYDVRLRALGSYPVYMFFVLSGFALTWVYFEENRTDVPTRGFFSARIARIVPLWWAVVVGSVVVALPSFPGWNAIAQNMTFLSALGATRDIPVGGWSIEVEVVFYLLFPTLLAFLRTPRALLVAVVVALVLRLLYVSATWPEGQPSPSGPAYLVMPSFLVFFLGGMLVAHIRRESSTRGSVWLGGAGVLLVAVVLSLNSVPLRELLTGPLSVMLAVTSIVAVGLVGFAPNPRSSPLRWLWDTLGQVSYGVYLLHPIVYLALRRLGLPAMQTMAVVVVASVALAWASHRWFEVPAARWTRRRLAMAAPAAARD